MSGNLTFSSTGKPSIIVPVAFSVAPAGGFPVGMVYSKSTARTSPLPLGSATVSGVIYPYLAPDTGVVAARFFLDNPSATGTPTRVDEKAPFDFAGSTSAGKPKPWDTPKSPTDRTR